MIQVYFDADETLDEGEVLVVPILSYRRRLRYGRVVAARPEVIDAFLDQIECMAIAYRPEGVP